MAINPSSRFAIALLIVHMMAAVVVYLTFMPLLAKLTLLFLLMLSLAYHLARDVFLLLSNSWREIALIPDGLFITAQNGRKTHGHIAGKTTVSPYFIVLRVRSEGNYFAGSRVIFPDALGKDMFRELCIRLRFS